MMRSLFSGVAGLKTHQTRMDVIGNNIANVNTTAFKSSTINFSDLMSQTTQQASGPNATTGTGGTNARQIGLGVKTGAITMNIEGQGSAQSTGNPFDIMITGNNFFVVSNGLSNFFTRDGSFYVDGGGNLAMTSTGYNVMGWLVDETTNEIKQDTVQALRIMSDANMTYPPEATSKAKVAGILDQNDTDVTSDAGKNINLNFYDALGYSYTARLTIKDSDTAGSFSVELTKLLDSNGNTIDISNMEAFGANQTLDKTTLTRDPAYTWDGNTLKDAENAVVATLPLEKDADGNYTEEALKGLDAIAKAYGYGGDTEGFLKLAQDTDSDGTLDSTIEDMLTAALPDVIEIDGRKIDGINVNFNTNTGAFTGLNGTNATTAVLGLKQLGGNFEDVTIDFSDMSMFNNNGTSTVAATSGDDKGIGSGRMLGDMIGVSIAKDGLIHASYDNGMTKLLGQIATASFANSSGLSKEGDNLYSATMNSGEFDGIGVDITTTGGYMTTGVLEMSNVDLSNEFTTMITTQRGFQANSRIITVSDTLLEELTNLKR
ncbi:MAG: flagellar hook-basal body complex protein [Lachnospiraceae bacterium]|nr:flagellar hook-basal body complex protein [Lachnospiraceae bacterium]